MNLARILILGIVSAIPMVSIAEGINTADGFAALRVGVDIVEVTEAPAVEQLTVESAQRPRTLLDEEGIQLLRSRNNPPKPVFNSRLTELAIPPGSSVNHKRVWYSTPNTVIKTYVASLAESSKCRSAFKPVKQIETFGGAWENAHSFLRHVAACDENQLFDRKRQTIYMVEPDFRSEELKMINESEKASGGTPANIIPPTPAWPSPQDTNGNPIMAWHLGQNFTGLASALNQISTTSAGNILVAHLDTGYPKDSALTSPGVAVPYGANVKYPLPYNFKIDISADCDQELETSKELRNNASNMVPAHAPCAIATDPHPKPPDDSLWGTDRSEGEPTLPLLNNYSHGSGTLSVLAGPDYSCQSCGDANKTVQIGGNPNVAVFEVRIGPSVVHFNESSMVAGIQYAIEKNADLISLSHGGFPSGDLADAVNDAYEHGVPIFAASGDFYWLVRSLSPSTTVFPSRYDQVMSVPAATSDLKSYGTTPCYWCITKFWGGEGFMHNFGQWMMRGNYGPASITTGHTVAAFAPNITEYHASDSALELEGSGTSASTPQVAAAASIWLAKNLDSIPVSDRHTWKKSEAVYQAMLLSAKKVTTSGADDYFGQGLLNATGMLEHSYMEVIGQLPEPKLQCLHRPPSHADAFWFYDMLQTSIISKLLGLSSLDGDIAEAFREGLITELEQISYRSPQVAEVIVAIARKYLDAHISCTTLTDLGNDDYQKLTAVLESDGSSSPTLLSVAIKLKNKDYTPID